MHAGHEVRKVYVGRQTVAKLGIDSDNVPDSLGYDILWAEQAVELSMLTAGSIMARITVNTINHGTNANLIFITFLSSSGTIVVGTTRCVLAHVILIITAVIVEPAEAASVNSLTLIEGQYLHGYVGNSGKNLPDLNPEYWYM